MDVKQQILTQTKLGDGTLLSYRITLKDDSAATLADQRQTMVGTYSNAMYPFSQDGQQKIFIAGIRPTIVSSWNQTLFFSIVNLKVDFKSLFMLY